MHQVAGGVLHHGVTHVCAAHRRAAWASWRRRPVQFTPLQSLCCCLLAALQGRVGILKVHARDKKVDPNLGELSIHSLSNRH